MSESRGRTIGLRIAFDGSEYSGWQLQPNGRAVEDAVRAAVERFEQRPTAVVGASRTDSGVHATGQYAHFCSHNLTIPAAKYAAALNRYLPPSITVLASDEHPPSFHARYSARNRTYLYKILISAHRAIPDAKYYAIRSRPPRIAQCNRALAAICGTHDFYSFSKGNNDGRSTMRTVYQAAMYTQGRCIVIKIRANAFLRTMVRSIVGTVLDDARCNVAHIENMLYNHDRSLSGEIAPACGLYLDWIDYER